MKNFLSNYMRSNRHASDEELKGLARAFLQSAAAIRESLGARPFHIRNGLNAAVYDAVSVAFSSHLSAIPDDIGQRYAALLGDSDFLTLVGAHTTDNDVVERRLLLAETYLFD